MELKTLKDFEWDEGLALYANVQALRAEAVKWIKTIDSVDDYAIKSKLGFVTAAGNYNLYGARQWIKHFFNIKEEELK